MLSINGSKSAYLLSLLLLQLAVFQSTNALPAGHHGPSFHISRHARSGRPQSSQPPFDVPGQTSQQYLRQRRRQVSLISSTKRDGAASNDVHHIDSKHIPQELTPVQHVVLARRHRDYDYQDDAGDDNDDATDASDSTGGHDSNGYDNGSWRGNNGDYGSEDSTQGASSDNGGQDDDSTANVGKAKIKTAKSSTGDSDDSGDGDAGNDQTTDNTSDDSEDTGDDDSQDLQPAGSIKATSTDDGNDDDATEDDTTATASSSASSATSTDTTSDDSDDSTQSDAPSATPTAKTKTVKSSKGIDAGDDTESTKTTSSKAAPSSDSAATTGTGDCATLSKVYDDMGGANWTVQDGWTDMSEKCCQAYGVSCDADSKVTALDLEANGLTGSLSASVFDLAALIRLNMTSNSISGSIPDKFDSLPHLSTVYLDQNSLSGVIPATLQNSSSVSSIHVSNNTLDGMLYFPNAYNLTQLYASKNQFTYLNIDANTALSKVILDDNSFNCTLPNMQNFTSLQVFSGARNSFSGSPFDVTNLNQLTKLDLQHNLLTGSFPDVTKLASLEYLALNGNDLSGHFPTGPAPTSMTLCHVDPILTSSCPSSSVMNDPNSLAAKCQLKCRGGGKPVNATQQDDSDASEDDGDGDDDAPQTKGRIKTKSAAGEEGSTVDGDDSGQTPASLAAAFNGGASRFTKSHVASYAIPVLLSLSVVLL